MELIMYRINAFSNQLNGGNPACVIRLNTWLKDQTMLAIAKKNGVPETAFFIKKESNIYFHRSHQFTKFKFSELSSYCAHIL